VGKVLLPPADSGLAVPAGVYQKATAITVKVLSGETSGSGILIHKDNHKYTVLTNDHVLIFSRNKTYQIKTPDGKIHAAQQVKAKSFSDYDLGLLEFYSPQNNYQVVPLSKSLVKNKGQKVFAAGFPFEATQLVVNCGYLDVVNSRSFGGGYRLGLTLSVKKGMSGGPLLNEQGQVIGINGKHKYPLWGNPYIFDADRSLANPQELNTMSRLSWAIPVETFLQLAPEFGRKY
jgi:S1-C subfamily serine protease